MYVDKTNFYSSFFFTVTVTASISIHSTKHDVVLMLLLFRKDIFYTGHMFLHEDWFSSCFLIRRIPGSRQQDKVQLSA